MYLIEKVSEVKQVQLLVTAGKRDAFQGTMTQQGTLPNVFSYGKSRVMRHQCANCGQEVIVDFAFGGQILAGGDLSRQGFHEDRRLLDAVGTLFGQYLHHNIDENGFETYLYLNAPPPEGALLDIAYYRCGFCQAQYLMLHKEWLKEDRPPFEPDELSIKQIFQVQLDHDAFMQVFRPPSPVAVS